MSLTVPLYPWDIELQRRGQEQLLSPVIVCPARASDGLARILVPGRSGHPGQPLLPTD